PAITQERDDAVVTRLGVLHHALVATDGEPLAHDSALLPQPPCGGTYRRGTTPTFRPARPRCRTRTTGTPPPRRPRGAPLRPRQKARHRGCSDGTHAYAGRRAHRAARLVRAPHHGRGRRSHAAPPGPERAGAEAPRRGAGVCPCGGGVPPGPPPPPPPAPPPPPLHAHAIP